MTSYLTKHLTRVLPTVDDVRRSGRMMAMGALIIVILTVSNMGFADSGINRHSGETSLGHSHTMVPIQWEGSPEGIAFSEFNHALAGLGVILVGFTELRTAMGWMAFAWSRWLLPAALGGLGIFLLIWSDHEAWPIGSWTLADTFSGKDSAMLQHKIFGLLSLGVGIVEGLRRSERFSHWAWSALLPGFALIGGGMLFLHMHGLHPAGHQIQIHHYVMGALALAGGLAWFGGELQHQLADLQTGPAHVKSILKILWALLVVTIGVQLLFYSET